MQPLATDVRFLRHKAYCGTTGENGDAIAVFEDRGQRAYFFFPGAQTSSKEEMGVSVDESRMTVKVPWYHGHRPGDRLADEDGNELWDVVSVTDYPGHQTLEVRPR